MRHIALCVVLCVVGCDSSAPTDVEVARGPATTPTAAGDGAPDTTKPPSGREVSRPLPAGHPLTKEHSSAGWISLFDGETLYGWESNNPDVNWSVVDGTITADSGPVGLLNTTAPFADYELSCEFRLEAEGNSGVFLRTEVEPKDVKTDCYELNMADAHPQGYTTGAIVGHAQTAEPILGSGGWKKFDVRVEGTRIVVNLDGSQVLEYTDPDASRRTGRIGLQKNVGKIEFRNLLLRPLGTRPLFNGTDLSGWRVVPGSQSEFTVEGDAIHVHNGPGFLETLETYGDFVLQCDAKTGAKDLNSGYFFRAEAGTEEAPSNGYEVQIHNGYKQHDRTQPANAGTGAIFRRTTARRVVPNDGEWCTITQVAAGPRFAVWVDGYQVTDWVDDRGVDENPRKGRRDHAGHISLQGHDPTTDVYFRRLQMAAAP